MRRKKVLGIQFFPTSIILDKMERLGHQRQHRQVRIICLCTGLKDANRICENYGLGNRVFVAEYVCESGNMEELEVMKNTELAVLIYGSTCKYIPVQQLVDNK